MTYKKNKIKIVLFLRYGGLIVLYQTSPESPDIFRIVHALNTAETTEALKTKALAAGLTEQEFMAYMVYCAGLAFYLTLFGLPYFYNLIFLGFKYEGGDPQPCYYELNFQNRIELFLYIIVSF